jgi:hypothetical protein
MFVERMWHLVPRIVTLKRTSTPAPVQRVHLPSSGEMACILVQVRDQQTERETRLRKLLLQDAVVK